MAGLGLYKSMVRVVVQLPITASRISASHFRKAAERWNRSWLYDTLRLFNGYPTTAVVRETLEAPSELDSTLEKRAELTDRIAKMQRDQIQFRTEVDALAASVGLSPSPD